MRARLCWPRFWTRSIGGYVHLCWPKCLTRIIGMCTRDYWKRYLTRRIGLRACHCWQSFSTRITRASARRYMLRYMVRSLGMRAHKCLLKLLKSGIIVLKLLCWPSFLTRCIGVRERYYDLLSSKIISHYTPTSGKGKRTAHSAADQLDPTT